MLEWNLAFDPFCRPHMPGGKARCVGVLTIGEGVARNVACYVIAHAAKLIRPGSVRIYSDEQLSITECDFPDACGRHRYDCA